jgi:hypothetical protein
MEKSRRPDSHDYSDIVRKLRDRNQNKEDEEADVSLAAEMTLLAIARALEAKQAQKPLSRSGGPLAEFAVAFNEEMKDTIDDFIYIGQTSGHETEEQE